MTLMNPKIPRRRNVKNPKVCLHCGCLYEVDERGKSSKYCRRCRPIVKSKYEKMRYQERKQRCLQKAH
jgi:hypothetical protein